MVHLMSISIIVCTSKNASLLEGILIPPVWQDLITRQTGRKPMQNCGAVLLIHPYAEFLRCLREKKTAQLCSSSFMACPGPVIATNAVLW